MLDKSALVQVGSHSISTPRQRLRWRDDGDVGDGSTIAVACGRVLQILLVSRLARATVCHPVVGRRAVSLLVALIGPAERPSVRDDRGGHGAASEGW